MAPALSVALKIAAYLVTHKDEVAEAVKTAQDLFGELPGESRFAVVRDFITEALDMTDPDDKTWEKAWRIVRPFFDMFVAKVKGKVVAAAQAA